MTGRSSIVGWLALILGLTLIRDSAADPCKCGPTPALREAFDHATDVLLVRIEDVDGPYFEDTDVGTGATIEPRFRGHVLARWKGRSTASVLIRSALDPARCSFPLVVGETYVLYADRPGRGDTLRADACTRSVCAALASEEMRQLDSLRPRAGAIPARLAPPENCPVHRTIPLRATGTQLVYQIPASAEQEYRRLRATRFPYAALQFENIASVTATMVAVDGVPAITCALCRARALAWCRSRGASCPPMPGGGMSPWYPSWPGFEVQGVVQPDRHVRLPKGVAGFYYDDGNRLRYDSLTGDLTRHVEGYGDTTIQVRLDEAVQARINRDIVESGFFKLALPEDESARFDTHGPCGLVEFCAASDSTQRCDWWDRSENLSSLPSRARFTRVLEEIRTLLEGSAGYRALPPLPQGL
jgi:hypothetical protein